MMKKIILSLACLFGATALFAQVNMQGLFNHIKPSATASQNFSDTIKGGINYQVRLGQLFDIEHKAESLVKGFVPKTHYSRTDRAESYPDTLIVGAPPYDSLVITGTFTHTGPIFVALNGVLIIKNATFTNLGDMYVFNSGKVLIDSSNVSFPQSYFYERSIILLNKGYFSMSNTTFTNGGFSHNFVVTDTAQAIFYHVTQPDWMTTGLSRSGTLNMNGTNQAGEFIIEDYCTLNIKNATTAILWHQFPDTSVINFSFGKSDTAYGYHFNNTVPGVKGVEYNVNADSVYHVMWSMMPSSGSNVTITNSKIRSIGVFFDKPADSVMVSGITDNATYLSTFIAPLSDRNLTFNNCTVQTWSFYVFHKSIINVSGCIAGEIGAYNSSKIYANSYVVDGSGGYHYASDTAVVIANALTATTTVRSEHNGIFIAGYSTIGASGNAEAIGNSLLYLDQTSVPVTPQALEGSDIWFGFINQPGTIFADSIAPVNGSAWIHRGPTSNWMHFKSWQLFYQKYGDTGWTAITSLDTVPVSNNLLANWDTHGLIPGNYLLKLTLHDDWGNSMDAELLVNLLDKILGVNNVNAQATDVKIYPNPNNGKFAVQWSVNSGQLSDKAQIEIYNMLGQSVYSNTFSTQHSKFNINLSSQPAGIYMYRVVDTKGKLLKAGKIVIEH